MIGLTFTNCLYTLDISSSPSFSIINTHFIAGGIGIYLDGFYVPSSGLSSFVTNCTFSFMNTSAIISSSRTYHPLIVTNSTFNNNNCSSVTHQGGAIRVYGGNVTVSGCQFSNNHGKDGGAIFGYNGSISVDHSTFFFNSAASYGSAIGVDKQTPLSISDCQFSNNGPSIIGVVQAMFSPSVTIIRSGFNSNYALGSGSIYVHASSLTLLQSSFFNNTIGGVVVYNSYAIIENSAFDSNTGPAIAGAIHYNSYSNGTINSCTFTNNKAPAGAVAIQRGDVIIKSSTFDSNFATHQLGGGGLFFQIANILVEDSNFYNNFGLGRKGAFYGDDTNVQFTNTTFINNTMSSLSTCNITIRDSKFMASKGAFSTFKCGVIISDSEFADGYQGDGVLLFTSQSVVQIDRCLFSNNTGSLVSALSVDQRSVANVSHTCFIGNSGSTYGAIAVQTTSSATFENITCRGNAASPNLNIFGGGCINVGSASVVIRSSTISNNTAGYGGGIQCVECTIHLLDTIVEGNEALKDGGGIHAVSQMVQKNVTFLVESSYIGENTARENGGGVAITSLHSRMFAHPYCHFVLLFIFEQFVLLPRTSLEIMH